MDLRSSPVKQYVPRMYDDFYWSVTVVVSAIKNHSQYRSHWHCLRVDAAWISLLSQRISCPSPP